ncbi:MAG: DMT family transporter [Candidatus Bathyarchaeia archaeon]
MARWLFFAFAAAFFWGTSPIAVKLIESEIHPFAIAFYRVVFTLPLFLVFLFATGRIRVVRVSFNRSLLFKLIFLGAVGIFAFNALFILGVDNTLANRSSLFVMTYPIIIPALSVLLLQEKITIKKALGIALGFLGILVVFSPAENLMSFASQYLAGDLLSLSAGASWAIFTVMGKRWHLGLDPYTATFAFSIFGTIFLAVLAIPFGILPEISPRDFVVLLYMAAFTVFVSYSVYMAALRLAHASRVGVVQFATPIVTAILSVTILTEPIGVSFVAGLGLIGFGIYLALRA